MSDLRTRRVPNALNGALAAVGLTAQVFAEGWHGLLTGVLGMAVAFGLVLVPFAMRLYRGGDAKLVIALGAWLGPLAAAYMFLWGVALGGLVAAGMVLAGGPALRRRVGRTLKDAALTATLPQVEPDRPARLHAPMALAFSAGAVVARLWEVT